MTDIVVVGAGQAGAALAAKLRALGATGRITLLGDEPVAPYQRPPLSKAYLTGEMGVDRLTLRADGFWAAHGIDLRTGARVTAIDRAARVVRVGAEAVPYDALALTTGSVARRLPTDLGGVFAVRTLADVDAMKDRFVPRARVVIVGGGYVGLEAAAVAAKLGLEVTVLEAAPRILARVASAETAAFFRDLHRVHGVTLLEGAALSGLEGEGEVEAAVLADGTRIPCEFVIAGIGIAPATALAEAAGLALDNGIAVDAFGRTSDPAIWAAGDCASFPHGAGRLRLESVPHAIDHAEAVAANMLGAERPYAARPWFWSDQFDVKLQIAGLNTGHDRVVTRAEGGTSFWYFAGGRLLAVDAANDPRAYMVGKRLIEAGRSPTPEAVATAAHVKDLL
ncbi:NAD(P)/FAD-dependent oxidoreductase [Falsirhodobacter sp. 20TX0035]|uniref:NAD(P)/FAD-dependent oxidoreductase n=1 Tax=Falsirhodobacter sp. 20TX0035 TaxID=3022019 RepID=UPI00232BE3E1|nr:FAD-dependent oxidoreductase [Falsirhodobacter sp. 20TX0035]MDB6454012.1 FAD-dependent oxidoreductase [Falsirhodobacter sp. 20TX0035]